eukprot:CAMPEP_0197000080 /NCGR_PEP_ID=MMETSP1380-20130617/5124_1 /TAXON_ID=5936 /ORGANISM="Euplotes crassus, Strain CT5" /LENGTH=290 /DNA_ID=CAMNT_0042417253 /DNA_START=356 /DNA_END=1226 /DNA_ORIENTATION=+
MLEKESKCPFCRNRVFNRDLVKNKLANELRETICQNEKNLGYDPKCPSHSNEGILFCLSCDNLICTECITHGIHTGHKLVNLKDKPEISKKMRDSQKLKNSLEEFSKLMDDINMQVGSFLDIDEDECDKLAQMLKSIITEKIDSCVENHKQGLKAYKNAYKTFLEDRKLMKLIVPLVMRKGKYTSHPNQLREKVYVAVSEKGKSRLLGQFLFEDPPVSLEKVKQKYQLESYEPLNEYPAFSSLLWDQLLKSTRNLPKIYSPLFQDKHKDLLPRPESLLPSHNPPNRCNSI